MRALRAQLEQEFERNARIAEQRQARVARGELPFTELELRGEHDPNGPAAKVDAAYPPREMAHGNTPDTASAATTQQGNAQGGLQPPLRKDISTTQDVNDLLYALHSKNDLAIDEALQRIAGNPLANALAQRGRDHLEANAQQEAQEQVTARQALGMDVAAEVQTSRGPVMVLTLPQFATGPMMQQGPQGDGGGDGGGGGAGGGGGGGGG